MRPDGEFVSAASRLFREGDELRATVVVKACFALVARGPMRLVNPQPLQTSNRFYDDDPRRSLRFASEVAPVVPQAEVTLIGNAEAFAPVPSRLVRLVVARGQRLVIDKSLMVIGNRAGAPGQPVPDPALFTTMPIRYDRAVGGPNNLDNPCGTGLAPTMAGQIVYPNVLYPEAVRQHVPAGFGPIAPSSALRKRFLGSDGQALLTATVQTIGVNGIPAEFFQTVPPDQRSAEGLQGDERITLVGLVKDAEVFETDLPRARATARVAPSKSSAFEVDLRLDTVSLDAQAGTASLLFRGAFPIADERVLANLRIEGVLRTADGNQHSTVCPPLPSKVPPPTTRAAGTAVWDAQPSVTQTAAVAGPGVALPSSVVPFAGPRGAQASQPSSPIPGAPWAPNANAIMAQPARSQQSLTFSGEAPPPLPALSSVSATPAPAMSAQAMSVATEPLPGTASAPARRPTPPPNVEPFSGTPGAQFLAALESPYE